MSEAASEKIRNLLATPEAPELGPGPRANVQSESALNAALESAFQAAGLTRLNQQPIRALVLLWHDHLDASHTLSQGIENSDGSLVHAILHRREPDYGNSKYWWRRVGKHPCFPEIARRVAGLLKSKGERDLTAKLLPRGEWDAFAFVDVCEAAADSPDAAERTRLLREIQRIESEVVLDYLLNE